MIISHTHKYIFIKSAKTAGTSLEAALSQHCAGNDVVTPLGHYASNRDEKGGWIHKSMNAGDFQQHEWGSTVRDKVGPEIWSGYFKFSIARNPWDRIVSLFSWKARNDPALQPKKHFANHLGVPFNELRELRRLFRKFVKVGEWKTNDRFYIIDNHLCVDFVIRYEHLADDVLEMCRRVGLPPIELPRLKTGMRPGQYHYSEYYDEETQAIVAERHEQDLRLFGYKFEVA